jgi:CheY-like chemotaxis protein
MPEMDGYEAMRRLRSEKRFAKLPVLALTAKAMKGERERCMEAGASDYLSKPVEPEKLLTTLAQWLRSGASHDHERD